MIEGREANLTRLMHEIGQGSINDIAHALIYFEKPEPTIAQSIENAVSDALRQLVLNKWQLWPKVQEHIDMAMAARRSRLGDTLWFSNY